MRFVSVKIMKEKDRQFLGRESEKYINSVAYIFFIYKGVMDQYKL